MSNKVIDMNSKNVTAEPEQEPKALTFYRRELLGIQDVSIRGFFYNALAVAPESFHADEKAQKHAKAAYHVLRGILDARHVEGAIRDALLGTTLICDIMVNEMPAGMESMHGIAVRDYLKDRQVHTDINQAMWENIMRAVESHSGEEVVSPLLAPKPGTAEYEIALAFMIAKFEHVKLDWGVIYDEMENETSDKETT